jgi:hypothetical protein
VSIRLPRRSVREGGCVLMLDFIHANDSLVSETAEMGFVGGTRCPLARRSNAKAAQRVGKRKRIRRRIFVPSARIVAIVFGAFAKATAAQGRSRSTRSLQRAGATALGRRQILLQHRAVRRHRQPIEVVVE